MREKAEEGRKQALICKQKKENEENIIQQIKYDHSAANALSENVCQICQVMLQQSRVSESVSER